MFNLVHNIDFVIAAVCVILIVYVSVGSKYSKISKSNKMFFRMVNTALIQSFVDIFMNVAETYTDIFAPELAGIARTVFNALTCLLTFFVYAYVKAYSKNEDQVEIKQKILDIIVYTFVAGFLFMGILNLFNGWISYIDENGVFQTGPGYSINYIVPFILIVCVLITAIRNRRTYTKEQFRAIIFFMVLVVAGLLIESLLHAQTLMIMFGISLAILTIQMSLETPDYRKMMDTMEELRKSNEAVEKARADAIRASQAKSDFLARMSHEIRTPMNAIVGMNELIVKGTDDPEIRGYAADAYQSANNLLKIINDILDFSKIESGKMTLIEEPYDMEEALREVYTIFKFKAEDKGLTLSFNIDPNLPKKVVGDYVRIKQIITNLLNNAMKYTDKGMIMLKVTCEENDGENVRLSYSVNDSGRGIRQEDISKLFEAFERIDEENNRNIEGTGLGINIVMQLLQMMGSKLEVESVFGKGSRFYFTLNQKITDNEKIGLFDATRKVERPEEEGRELIYAPEAKILVVDDNEINLRVFEGLLKKTGVQVTKANGGQEAVTLARNNKYDIIFMDHMMPHMDGIEAMHLIRNEESMNNDSIIIVLTANAIKGSQEMYLEEGFDDVAFKPTTQKELNEKLWYFLRDSVKDSDVTN